jgi:hypothetical protein
VRAVEKLLANCEHVLRRDLALHEHKLRQALVPVMNALIIASASRDSTAIEILMDDIARLHSAALVAHTCAGDTSVDGRVVSEIRTTAAHAK